MEKSPFLYFRCSKMFHPLKDPAITTIKQKPSFEADLLVQFPLNLGMPGSPPTQKS